MASLFGTMQPLNGINLRRLAIFIGLPVVFGIFLGALILFLPLNYLLFTLGGLVFSYLLLFKIEYAAILALLIQNQLSRFNYMGGGTPFHPNGFMGIAIIAGAVFYFVFHKLEMKRFRGLGIFLAYLIVSGFSLVNEDKYLMDGITIFLRLATALAIYAILVYRLDSIQKIKWVLAAVIAAQIIPTVSGLLMYAGKTGMLFTDETMRLGHSGVGAYLSMISSLCLIFFFGSKSSLNRILWGALSILFLTGLFFSFGRSGWIGFVVSMMIIALIRYKRLIFILPILLVILVLLIPAFGQRFSDISFSSLGDEGSSTLAQRVNYWISALEVFREHPFLGVGFGVGRYVVGDYRDGYPGMIHNDYICVLLETGLIGFIVFLLWQSRWVYELIIAYRRTKFDFDKTFTLGVLTIFVASLVMRITDNMLLDTNDMYPLCALIASTLAIPRIRETESMHDNSPEPAHLSP